jgi:hypothetical protein
MLWRFKDASWEQDELKNSFKLHSISGRSCNSVQIAPIELLLGAKLHPENGLDCARHKYPTEFQFCPVCQARLFEVEGPCREIWIPPYGAGTGMKIIKGSDTLRQFSIKDVHVQKHHLAKPFPLPGRDGTFSFCSIMLGAKHRMLFALQRDIGRLWVYRNDEDDKWGIIDGVFGTDSLPGWSWSIATDKSESGICAPTDNGPVWMTVDWISNRIQVNQTKARSIGAPMRVGEYLFAPVARDGRFAMVYRKEGEADWMDCPSTCDPSEVIAQLKRKPDQLPYFGIPYFNKNKNTAYWSCRGGYVSVTVPEYASGVEWKFRTWETDEHPATALIELGPPYRTTGSEAGFWQLCEDVDQSVREGVVNKIIKIDGDEHIDFKRIQCGEFVSTGRSSFSWGYDYWDDITKLNSSMPEQSELRYPLLQFGDNGMILIAKVTPWEGRDELGVFTELFYNRNLNVLTTVRLVLEGAGVPERPLFAEEVDGVVTRNIGSFFRISLSRLPELRAFIYNQMLCVHFPENNSCFSWPIEITEKS